MAPLPAVTSDGGNSASTNVMSFGGTIVALRRGRCARARRSTTPAIAASKLRRRFIPARTAEREDRRTDDGLAAQRGGLEDAFLRRGERRLVEPVTESAEDASGDHVARLVDRHLDANDALDLRLARVLRVLRPAR